MTDERKPADERIARRARRKATQTKVEPLGIPPSKGKGAGKKQRRKKNNSADGAVSAKLKDRAERKQRRQAKKGAEGTETAPVTSDERRRANRQARKARRAEHRVAKA